MTFFLKVFLGDICQKNWRLLFAEIIPRFLQGDLLQMCLQEKCWKISPQKNEYIWRYFKDICHNIFFKIPFVPENVVGFLLHISQFFFGFFLEYVQHNCWNYFVGDPSQVYRKISEINPRTILTRFKIVCGDVFHRIFFSILLGTL